MSERPDFAGVLAEHVLRELDSPTACTCGWNWDWREVILPSAVDFDPSRYRLSNVVRPDQHRAHLSAALNAELDRWLGDEGTREVVARELLDSGASPGASLHSWRCEYPDRYGDCDCVTETARDVLAALTTTDPKEQP